MVSKKARVQVVLLIVFSIGVSGLILRAQVPLEVGRRDWASSLPDGEGKGLVLGTCTQCHSLSPIALQRKSNTAWELLVRDMISRGAQIQVAEIDPIKSYLARNFGPNSASLVMANEQQATARETAGVHNTPLTAATLPEEAGKSILLSSCTSCHVLSKTTNARKDEAGWRGNVKDMIRLGAKLSSEEEAVLVAYLAKHFSPQGASGAVSSSEPQSFSIMSGIVRANTAPNPAQLMPDDEGKGLILATCFQCHSSPSYVSGNRKTPAAWRRTVNDMISRGAQVTPQEAEIIIKYLVKHMAGEKKAE
jgi:cytochrome c5